MEKKNFVSLIMGTVGGILFGIGMCMCLLPEWNAFRQGILVSAVGAVVLLAMLSVRRKMEGKPAIQLNAKAVGSVHCRRPGAWQRYVLDNGMEHAGTWYCHRNCGYCFAAVFNPNL